MLRVGIRIRRVSLDHSWLLQHPIAHRGFHWIENLDENSREAFELGIQKNSPMECDLHLSRDGEVIVHHDSNLLRMTGMDREIGEMSAHELREIKTHRSEFGIMSLIDLLDLVHGQVPLVLEVKRTLKRPLLEKRVLEILVDYKGDYSLQSFHPKALMYLRKEKTDLNIGLLSGEDSLNHLWLPTRILLQSMSFVSRINPTYIGFEWSGLHRRAPQEMRKNRGIPLISWTVNDQKSLGVSRLLADNIIYENIDPKILD